MKKLVILICVAGYLVSCHNYKKDTEKLTTRIDSLEYEAEMKDSSIVGFLNDFNEIQANLDSIKKLEDLVTVQSVQGREMPSQQKKLILDDIELINNLLQENKERTASLQKKLNNSNFKVGKLQGMVTEFEKMVSNLERQIEQKDVEILALNEEVRKLNFDIGSLNQKIAIMEDESRQKAERIEAQTIQLNEAYYTYGSTRELKENGVIERTGGLLGIGKNSDMKEDFNRGYFTKIDIREFDFVPLMVKKAEVISVHPAGSFHISGEGRADTLFIDNKEEFWKASKYLVIETK
jgi:hypothetical protein